MITRRRVISAQQQLSESTREHEKKHAFDWTGAARVELEGGMAAFDKRHEESGMDRFIRDELSKRTGKTLTEDTELREKVVKDLRDEIVKNFINRLKRKPDEAYAEDFRKFLMGKHRTLNNPKVCPRGYQSWAKEFPKATNWAKAELDLQYEVRKYLFELFVKGPTPGNYRELEIAYRYLYRPVSDALLEMSRCWNMTVDDPEINLTRLQSGQAPSGCIWPKALTYNGYTPGSPELARYPLPINPCINRLFRDSIAMTMTYQEWMMNDPSKLDPEVRDLWEVVQDRVGHNPDVYVDPRVKKMTDAVGFDGEKTSMPADFTGDSSEAAKNMIDADVGGPHIFRRETVNDVGEPMPEEDIPLIAEGNEAEEAFAGRGDGLTGPAGGGEPGRARRTLAQRIEDMWAQEANDDDDGSDNDDENDNEETSEEKKKREEEEKRKKKREKEEEERRALMEQATEGGGLRAMVSSAAAALGSAASAMGRFAAAADRFGWEAEEEMESVENAEEEQEEKAEEEEPPKEAPQEKDASEGAEKKMPEATPAQDVAEGGGKETTMKTKGYTNGQWKSARNQIFGIKKVESIDARIAEIQAEIAKSTGAAKEDRIRLLNIALARKANIMNAALAKKADSEKKKLVRRGQQ